MLEILRLTNKFESFVVDEQAGLAGDTIIAQFPCILDSEKFYVWIGDTKLMLFGRSTICNLANLAESKNAESIIFILNRSHLQKSYYDKMFKVIDAELL